MNVRILILCCVMATSMWGQNAASRARSLHEAGRFQDAIVEWERALAQGPRRPEYLMGLGRSLLALKETGRSLALFQEVAAADTAHGEARYWTGRVLEQQGLKALEQGRGLAKADLRDAVIFYREAARLTTDAFPSRLAAGRVLMYLFDFDSAVEELRRAEKLRPDSTAWRPLLLGALFRSGRWSEFLELARRVPQDIDHLRELEAVVRLGRLEEARELFVQLFTRYGQSGRTEPFQVLAGVCTELRKRDFEIAVLQHLIKRCGGEFLARYYLGYALALRGDHVQAEEQFRRYLKERPRDWVALRHLASVLRLQGRLEDSVAVIKQALNCGGHTQIVQDEAAEIVGAFVQKRDFAQALELHRILLKHGKSADMRRNHAILLKENGRLEEARDMLQALCDEEEVEGLRLSGFWNDLALCLKGLGENDRAEKAFVKAIKILSFNADAHENLGVLYFEHGRMEAARESLLRAIDARSDEVDRGAARNFRARYYLGLIKSARISVPQSP